MDNKLKIFHVMGMYEYSSWIENREIVNTIDDADIVFFEGGEDVTPFLYGAKTNGLSYFNTARDEYEITMFKKAVNLGKFIWGTCRGLS